MCVKCWQLLHVGRDKDGRWVSSNVATHARVCSEGDNKRGKELREGDAARQDDKTEAMFQAGGGAASASGNDRAAGASGSSGAGSARSAFEIDTRARALAMQARFYVYGRQRISKASFDDPAWRDALTSAYQHGGGSGEMASLTEHGLSAWVNAEYDVYQVHAVYTRTHGALHDTRHVTRRAHRSSYRRIAQWDHGVQLMTTPTRCSGRFRTVIVGARCAAMRRAMLSITRHRHAMFVEP